MAKNIEEIFQEKLKNIEITPPENTWNLIEKRIKKIKLFKSLTILVSLTVVATVLYFAFNSNDNKTQSIQARNIELTQQNSRQPITVSTDNSNTIIMTIKTDSHTSTNNSVQIQNTNNNKPIDTDIDSYEEPKEQQPEQAKILLSSHKGCCPLVVKLNSDVNKENWTWKINGKEYQATNNLTITLNKPGTYPVVLQNSDDNKTVTDTIIVNAKPEAEFVVPDNIELKNDALFENTSKNADNFAWFIDGTKVSIQKNLLYTFSQSGNHTVMLIAINNECADTSLKVVEIRKPENHILFPTAFTPSRAGSSGGYYETKTYNTDNSVFHPYIYDKQVKSYRLSIYDRSGRMIFMSNELNRGWDGYYENKLMPIGVYVYIAKFEFEDGEKTTEQGNVTLIY